MRVVFDTNIYISAFVIPGGNAEEAYLHAVRGRFELFTSIAILTETAKTLRHKFVWSQDKIEDLLTNVGQSAVVVKTQPHIHILRDEPDNRTLECAVETEAELIVTGDRHLLALQRFQGTSIMKLSEFLALLRKPEEASE